MEDYRLKFPFLLTECFKYNLYVYSEDRFFHIINEIVRVKIGIEDTSFNINSWDIHALLDIVNDNSSWDIEDYIEFVCVLRKLCEGDLVIFYEMIGLTPYKGKYEWINIARTSNRLKDIVRKHFPYLY